MCITRTIGAESTINNEINNRPKKCKFQMEIIE